MSQLAQTSAGIEIEIPAPGIYAVVLELNGVEAKRIQFEALAQSPQ